MANLPICNGSQPNPQWNCIQDTPGATVLAALYNLSDHGQLDTSSANGIIASIVSYGFLTATTSCKQSFILNQNLSINCDNTVLGDAVANNPNCVACKAIMASLAQARNQLETDAHAANPNYTPQVPSQAILDIYNGTLPNHNDGACQYVCLQCIAKDINQTEQMTIDASCNTNTQSYISAFTNGMSYQAQVELGAQQNALKSVGYNIQNEDDVKKLSIQLADSITQMTKTESINALQQQALNIQQTIIDPGSTSVVLQHVNQTISLDMFASLASVTYSDARMKDAINFELTKKEIDIETSFTSLLQSLSTTVTEMNQLLLSIIGKILITILALLLTAVFLFVAGSWAIQRGIFAKS